MNSSREYFCMPPVNLGLHVDGMGSLLRSKVSPQVACKILLEAHRYTGPEALKDGIVDGLAAPGELYGIAIEWANGCKAKLGRMYMVR
ncbi:hypothetical protein DPV78_003250 [Talaromyces pinophilus]|nr:hypothetical protein DPV78_003250 [Talaromyces pinophilus]